MQLDLVIAILALVIAILSAYATRVHNRLSVRPYLHINRSFSDNKFRVYVRNSGTGPAIIRTVEATTTNRTLDATIISWTDELQAQCAILLADKHIPPPLPGTAGALIASTLEGGDVLAANEDYVLIRTDDRFDNPEAAAALYAYLLEYFTFAITYSSIYNEKFRYSESRRT